MSILEYTKAHIINTLCISKIAFRASILSFLFISDHILRVYEPLKPSKMPERPWQSVSADFFGPTPGGWYWFVNICDNSNWASVEKDTGNQRGAGRPRPGPPSQTAKLSGMDEQEALLEFLRRYRETTHSTTRVNSNHLLLGFSRSSGIPSMVLETPEQRKAWRKTALANDARANKRMVRIRVREPVITLGSEDLVKLSKHRKNTSTWDVVNPYTVTEVRRSMVTLTRNSSTFKLYRHAEIDESEPEASNPSVTSNSERREGPSPELQAVYRR
jgi:hypothetical protein